MDCRETRRLLDDGLAPGSSTPERAALGFHLAGCAACRSYRASPPDERLLAALLEERPVAVSVSGHALARRARRAVVERWVRRAGTVALALVALVGLYYVGQVAFAVATIAQNVRSMQVPTAPLATLPPLPTRPAAAPSAAATRTAPPSVAEQAAVAATAPLGAEPPELPPPATSAAWPTTFPPPASTPTLSPVPLGGDTVPLPATPLPAAPPLGFVAPPPEGAGVTVLLLGLDRRPGEGGPARMDAIIVARVEPERRRVALLSLPRDLIVEIPGYGYGRINAANVYGELYPQLGGGAASARNTVSQLLGIPIDYVVHIDFEGFIAAIDAIGGVAIDVPVELYDSAYPTMDYGYTTVHFLPGPQHMDGARALQYARVRHMDSDFARSRRQQQVILAAAERLRGQNIVELLNSVASVSGALRGYLTFDIPEDRLAGLVWAVRDITPEQVERYALDETQVWIGAPDDPYAEFAVPGAIESLVGQLMGR
jgi:LCP family protein required for cell wall assembly